MRKRIIETETSPMFEIVTTLRTYQIEACDIHHAMHIATMIAVDGEEITGCKRTAYEAPFIIVEIAA
jgi:hypothetical protein